MASIAAVEVHSLAVGLIENDDPRGKPIMELWKQLDEMSKTG
jgi:hypothetical protein